MGLDLIAPDKILKDFDFEYCLTFQMPQQYSGPKVPQALDYALIRSVNTLEQA